MAFVPQPTQTGTIPAAASITIAAAPAVNIQRMVNDIVIFNPAGNASARLTIRINDNSNLRRRAFVILQPEETYEYDGKSIILGTVNQTVEAILSAVPTAPLEFTTNYSDKT